MEKVVLFSAFKKNAWILSVLLFLFSLILVLKDGKHIIN